MTENLSLGRNGKSGDIDFSKIKSGIRKKELLDGVEPKLRSVFEQIINKIDTNPDDNMLSREELQSFYEELEKLSEGDGNLSSREARKYQLNGENIGRKGKDALFAVLNKLSELSKDVKEITQETVNGEQVEVIKYNNNKTERIFPDGSRIITVAKGNAKVSTTYDKDDNKKEESIAEGDFEETTSYEAGKKTKVVTVNTRNNTKTTVYYDDSEKPVRKEEQDGSVKKTFEAVNVNGQEQWRLKETIENVNGYDQKTVYEYDESGHKTGETITSEYGTTERTFNPDGTVTEVISNHGKPVHTINRAKDNSYTDSYQEENADITDYYNTENEHIAQKKDINGITYEVKYDDRGNTLGVIVQNGESIQEIADKFGVSVKDLIKVNASKVKGKYPNASFNAGEEIKIPRKLEADAPALQGRKSRDEVLAEYRADQQRRAEEARRRADAEAARRAEEEQQQKSKPQKYTLPSGRYVTVQRGKVKYYAADGTQLKKEYFESKEGKVVDMKPSGRYIVTIGGKSRYYAADGTELKESYFKSVEAKEANQRTKATNIQKDSARHIVEELKDAIKGWNDTDKIQRIIARIDNPEELAEVNRLLEAEGYKATDLYSSIERFIYEENNHSYVHTYNSSDFLEQTVQKWIDNGTLKGKDAINAQARMAARVIFDGGDGFGTDCDKIKKGVRMIKCPKPSGNDAADKAAAKAVYDKVNEILVKHRTFYGLGSPCKNLRDYCEGEMWESECRYLDGILAENNAIQGKQKAQAVHDLTEEAVSGAGTDIEYLTQAIKAINSREDRLAVEAKLEEYCRKHNVKPQYEGQSYLQAILYDECDTFMGISRDHKEIRKFNEMLIAQGAYNEQEIINLRAEQAALQIMEGDFANAKDAIQQIKDPKVYARMLQIFAKISGKSLANFFMAKLGQEKSDLVNAELAANSIIEGKEAADVAFRLILNSDYDKRAMGFKAIRNEEVATIVDGYLKTKGSSLAQELDKFNKEKAEYKEKAKFWDGLAKFILPPVVADTISDGYRENTDASDNMYVEAKTSQHLTKAQKSAYEMTVRIFEQKLNKMKEDYQKALDSQGVVSGAINAFCEAYGLGTTREEIEARIEHDTETLRLLKLAAEGKLAKVENGKTVAVSFEEVFAERNVGTNFDAAKVEKVAKQAETMVAMEYAKDNIAICWDELSNAKSQSQLSVAIIDTLEKLSAISGLNLSLEGFGYSEKNGIIVDQSGLPVASAKLQEMVKYLKQGLSDMSKILFDVEIPLDSSYGNVNEILENGYKSKMESFKQEFKDAFGQEVPDEMLEDYMSTINTGMTVLNVGVMIGAMVAAPFTGGGSLAVFAMTAAASMGLNALENSTDADGYTNSEWTSDAAQAMWDGALSAVGFKVGQFAEAFARGSQIASSQNKWISWLAKQPKGSLMDKLASIPRNQLGKVASKAKEVADKIQAYSGKIGKNVLEARKAQILAKNPGANLNSVEKASVLFARAEACGLEVTSDMIQSLVQAYCMTGEFDEESFLMALCMSLGANLVGHSVAAKNADAPQAPKAEGSPKAEEPNAPKSGETPNGKEAVDAERAKEAPKAEETSNAEAAQRAGEAPKTEEPPKTGEAPKSKETSEAGEGKETPKTEEAPKSEEATKAGSAQESGTAQKTYAEMNPDELFAEYKKLRQYMYAGLNTADKASNVSKMKEISTLLEQKGFRIEGDKLVKIKKEGSKSEAPKTEDVDIEDVRPSYENPEKAMNLRKRLNAKLFAMYQGIEKSIENLKDIAGYNKIKTIIANQFKNHFPEFSELIKRLNAKAKKIGLKVVENSIDRTARMGKSLAKFYTKMENAIAKMTNEKQFNKILKKITTRFAGFYDDMKTLIDKLYDRAKAIGLSVKESIQDVYKRVGIKTDGVSLDKYKPSGKGIDMSKSHDEWMNSRKDLFGNYSKEWGCWRSFDAKDQHHGAWKMHLYSVSEADWRKMCDVIIPYLKEHDIDWKTFGSGYGADYLNGSKQQGKAFTIYPKNNEDMAKIAKDLDYIIRNNKLEKTSGSHITGDAQLGSTGRLFYRYEFNSKQYQDEVLDLSNSNDRRKYFDRYDSNRGEGRHLADDMTPEDDIWRDFDPSDPNAQPYGVNGSRASQGANRSGSANNSSQNVDPNKARAYAKFDKNAPVYGLQQGQSVLNQSRQYVLDLNNLPRLTLLDGTTVDLNSAQIKNRIASLQEGEYITIGRQGDIRLNNAGNNVSRHHILITRHNGRIVMKDVSANGGTRCYSRAASQGANASGASGQANGASRGRTSTKAYTFNSMNDLKYQMREVLERFSINTQNKILHDLNNRGFCRLQKNGVEYLFVRRGNNVRLEEFNINAKYNIKETKIDDYNTQTTYDIDDLNDIWWAMSDKMPRFSPETQSYIINRLSNGETCRLRKGGIAYEFSIENGRITVKEQDYVRYNYDNGGRSESANGQNRSEGSSGSNRGQRADNSADRMSEVQKQERIHTIESILERADDIEKFRTKFADILSPDFKVTDEAGVQELKKITRFIKAFWHTDVGTGAPSDLQVICDELFNMTNGKYVVMGESRMGTPAEVNAMLDKLRELTNLDALRKELNSLKNVSSNANSNANPKFDALNDVNIWGFRRNPNAQTNVKDIKPYDVGVAGTNTGYMHFTPSKFDKLELDMQRGTVNGLDNYVLYNAKENITIIGFSANDAFGRLGSFQIMVTGQVSENDVVKLLAHLDSKGLLPRDRAGRYGFKDADRQGMDVRAMARKIQEEVAEFFK